MASGIPEAAICVQDIDVQCVLQFTLLHAAGCALHRHTSRVIHRLEFCHVHLSKTPTPKTTETVVDDDYGKSTVVVTRDENKNEHAGRRVHRETSNQFFKPSPHRRSVVDRRSIVAQETTLRETNIRQHHACRSPRSRACDDRQSSSSAVDNRQRRTVDTTTTTTTGSGTPRRFTTG